MEEHGQEKDDSQQFDNEIESMFNSWANTTDYEEVSDYVNEKVVAGLYENEVELQPLCTADDYSPEEIEDRLNAYFRYFSKSDMDLIYMNFIGDKTQVDLQEIFHKTQPAISCTSDRIKRQIGVVVKIQNVMDEFISFITDPNLKIPYRDKNILLVFFYSTSIIKTGRIIGINPMLCRARIDSALKLLKSYGHRRIYEYFSYILENLNKVKKDVSDDVIAKKPAKYDYPDGHVSQELPF